MNGETFVKLIEEMVNLKIQACAESNLRASPEVSRLLIQKRETDQRRLEHIRAERARLLKE